VKTNIDILKDKFEKTNRSNETEMHKKLKWWIAKRYLDTKVPVDNIEFEYKINVPNTNFIHTTPDVFIKQWGNIAIYCEIKCNWSFLRRMEEKYIPFLEERAIKIIAVFPKNVRNLYPYRSRESYFKELRDNGIEILYAPYYLDVDKMTEIELSQISVNILKALKDKHSKIESLDDFIKNELKNIVKR